MDASAEKSASLVKLRKGYRRVSIHLKSYEILRKVAYEHDMSMSSLLSLSLQHYLNKHMAERR
jgi:hypothetical protein